MRYEDLILKAVWLVFHTACFFRCQEMADFLLKSWTYSLTCYSIDSCPSLSPSVLSTKASDLRKSLRKRSGVSLSLSNMVRKTTLRCCCGCQKEFKIPPKAILCQYTHPLSHIKRTDILRPKRSCTWRGCGDHSPVLSIYKENIPLHRRAVCNSTWLVSVHYSLLLLFHLLSPLSSPLSSFSF